MTEYPGIERCGLLLLTGGQGARLGGPKHLRPHPSGLSWGAQLVAVFRETCPGPVQLLGAPLPELELPRVEDPRRGPAVALRHWVASGPPPARRWWILPCDQVRWDATSFGAWLEEAEAADPEGRAWVRVEGQPLGGFLGAALLPALAALEADTVRGLAATLPAKLVPDRAWRGADVDDPAELAAWEAELRPFKESR